MSVDGPAEPELAEEFAVTEYPTLSSSSETGTAHTSEEYTGCGAGKERAGEGAAGAEAGPQLRGLRRPRRPRASLSGCGGWGLRQAAGRTRRTLRTHGRPGCGGRPASSRCAEGRGWAWEQGVARRPHRPGPLRTCRTGTWLPFLGLAQDALDMTFGLTDRPQLFSEVRPHQGHGGPL